MLFPDPVYVGLEPAASPRPTTYAVIDADLGLVGLSQDDLEAVLAVVAEQSVAAVAVAAPQGLNQGLMARTDVRQRYGLQPSARTWSQWRVCEYELRRRNIRLTSTPGLMGLAPGWVQTGLKLFERLRSMGFRYFEGDAVEGARLLLEVHPHAGFSSLLERQPFAKSTLEGRLQRQLVLFLEGLDLPNPMRALEEITRHHMLSGLLPLGDLRTPPELDALLAAYTAYLAANRPARIVQLGDPEEGLITLPAAELQDRYP